MESIEQKEDFGDLISYLNYVRNYYITNEMMYEYHWIMWGVPCGPTLKMVEIYQDKISPWQPGRWWRVLGPEGDLICETSVELEAWNVLISYPGSRVQKQYVKVETEWRDL